MAVCPSCRPAAGCRAGEVSPGEEPGAGAGPAADVHHQPGAAAGDRGEALKGSLKPTQMCFANGQIEAQFSTSVVIFKSAGKKVKIFQDVLFASADETTTCVPKLPQEISLTLLCC